MRPSDSQREGFPTCRPVLAHTSRISQHPAGPLSPVVSPTRSQPAISVAFPVLSGSNHLPTMVDLRDGAVLVFHSSAWGTHHDAAELRAYHTRRARTRPPRRGSRP